MPRGTVPGGRVGSGAERVGLVGSGPWTYDRYPRSLGHVVRDERSLSLEPAVRKMPGAAAVRPGFRQRATVGEGNVADLEIRVGLDRPLRGNVGIDGLAVVDGLDSE